MAVALLQEALPYAATVALAVFAACAELIGRFRDEPTRVIFSRPGLLYLLLNAVLAAVALGCLRYADPPKSPASVFEQLFLAGFGARVLLRTKVVGAQGKDGAADTGPGAVFERLLARISRSADRSRATYRLQLVRELLDGVDWIKIRAFFPAELGGALQDLADQEKEEIRVARNRIEGQADLDDLTRVHLLGYLILTFGGEEFLKELASLYRKRFPPGPSGPASSVPPP
jgi:hypothetical protein